MLKKSAVELLEKACEGKNHRSCALMQLKLHLGNLPGGLSDIAEVAGFTHSQAHGIMDGWDSHTATILAFENQYKGKYALFTDDSKDVSEYDEGFELGKRLRVF